MKIRVTPVTARYRREHPHIFFVAGNFGNKEVIGAAMLEYQDGKKWVHLPFRKNHRHRA